MYLKELIEALEAVEDKAAVLPIGFAGPHSYRGYYDQLAFEPAANVTVQSMLDAAKSAMGRTFTGYKGGEFVMGEYTDCWLADYGCCGETIGPMLLRFMLSSARRDA